MITGRWGLYSPLTNYEHMLIIKIKGETGGQTEKLQAGRFHAWERIL